MVPNYGTAHQYTKSSDTSPLLDKAGIKPVQITILGTLIELAASQSALIE